MVASARPPQAAVRSARPRFGEGFERLEPREVPATFTVSTEADVIDPNDGKVSRREAVAAANALNDGSVIGFDFGKDLNPKIIRLGSQLELEKNI